MFMCATTGLKKRPLALVGLLVFFVMAPIATVLLPVVAYADAATDTKIRTTYTNAVMDKLCTSTNNTSGEPDITGGGVGLCDSLYRSKIEACINTEIKKTKTYPKLDNTALAACIAKDTDRASQQDAILAVLKDSEASIAERQEATEEEEDTTSSCEPEGIGWTICPISRAIASFVGLMFDIMTFFLEVPPMTTNPNAGLYKAWEVMRNIANVVFVGIFILIIYSQIVGGGRK